MWPDTPEQRFMYIAQRQAELRAEAGTDRIRPRRAAGSRAIRLQGLRIHIGTLLIVIGRTLCDEDGRLTDPAH
jgi:hypothetical protein